MRSVVSIDVGAPPEVVFDLVRNVERWAVLLPHYRSVRALRRSRDGSLLAAYVAMLPGPLGLSVPVPWRSWSSSDPETRELRFRHAGGVTDGMQVTWRIERVPSGSRVAIEHRFVRPLPVLRRLGAGRTDELIPLLVDRLVVRPIARRTLEAVRAAAESQSHAQVAGCTGASAGQPRSAGCPADPSDSPRPSGTLR